MNSRYDEELDRLGETYEIALKANIDELKVGIVNASEASVIAVGSGGSYTVASLLCALHEAHTGRISRPSTPLEIISNPTLASTSPIFFVSAEGKNPDIVEAFLRARLYSARDVHIISNRTKSPLLQSVATLTDVNAHIFELTQKDGYLATNSLVLDALIVARAYEELDQHKDEIPKAIKELRLKGRSIPEWIQDEALEFAQEASKRPGVIVVHSPALKPIAADLESKLSEGALLHCQVADLRSFAHGRHLWLAERPNENVIVALIDPTCERLWNTTAALIPAGIPSLTLATSGTAPRDLLSGLVAELHLVSVLARALGKDPARPAVQQFGRDLYYANLPELIDQPSPESGSAELSKYSVLGAHWPSITRRESMHRAAASVRDRLLDQNFRAVVFDYDGTLCSSNRRDLPPSTPIVEHLQRLTAQGIIVGIASGRGGSLHEQLRIALPKEYWENIQLALYSGGWVGDLSSEIPSNTGTSEFLSHAERIVGNLKNAGVPIENFRASHPFQVSVRFRPGIEASGMWFVIADALRQAGMDYSTVFRSRHSVDILRPGISKSRLVTEIIKNRKIDPYEILTMGDQGAWPGNDSSLLDHKYSLSVAIPSRKMDRGWKLAPAHKRDVDATIWYLEALDFKEAGTFSFNASIRDDCEQP